jgi:hypothetical protein
VAPDHTGEECLEEGMRFIVFRLEVIPDALKAPPGGFRSTITGETLDYETPAGSRFRLNWKPGRRTGEVGVERKALLGAKLKIAATPKVLEFLQWGPTGACESSDSLELGLERKNSGGWFDLKPDLKKVDEVLGDYWKGGMANDFAKAKIATLGYPKLDFFVDKVDELRKPELHKLPVTDVELQLELVSPESPQPQLIAFGGKLYLEKRTECIKYGVKKAARKLTLFQRLKKKIRAFLQDEDPLEDQLLQ